MKMRSQTARFVYTYLPPESQRKQYPVKMLVNKFLRRAPLSEKDQRDNDKFRIGPWLTRQRCQAGLIRFFFCLCDLTMKKGRWKVVQDLTVCNAAQQEDDTRT